MSIGGRNRSHGHLKKWACGVEREVGMKRWPCLHGLHGCMELHANVGNGENE